YGPGIAISGTTTNQTTGNVIQGNYIGTNAAGTAAIPNGMGIQMAGADSNIIGGSAPGAGHLISWNLFAPVDILSSDNIVQGNLIGTDASGKIGLAGNFFGVELGSGSGNLIGGTDVGEGNVISGNNGGGVHIGGGNNNIVQGNFIGTDITGTL